MTTVSLEPGMHPRRRASVAAHALRSALASAGLLDCFPQCRSDVEGERGIVHLGDIDAGTALALAELVARGAKSRSQRRPSTSGDVPRDAAHAEPAVRDAESA